MIIFFRYNRQSSLCS